SKMPSGTTGRPMEGLMPDVTFAYLPITTELSYIQVRSVKYWGVEKLKRSMKERGFLDGKPVEIARRNGSLRLFEGRHRWQAAQEAGIEKVTALIYEGLSDEEQYRRAFLANESHDAIVPQTFVDHAELIWHLSSGRGPTEVAKILGWGNPDRVTQYKALQK